MRHVFWTLIVATLATMPVTELLRSIIHRRRARVHPLAGTQDIAMIGTLIFAVLFAATVVVSIVGHLIPPRGK